MEGGAEPFTDLGRLAPNLQETCAEYLERYRRELRVGLAAGEPGLVLAQRYARSLDGLLSALACASLAIEAPSKGAGVAVAAVGGYGRGQVALHSDVDVVFLCRDSKDPRVHRVAERFLYPLWDIGLPIGHAVRTVDETLELARVDLATATTLLDIRFLSGDRTLCTEVTQRGSAEYFEPKLEDFLEALSADMVRRHKKSGDSPYLLEPDLKHGRGGLRDLDVANWVARARWRSRTPSEHVQAGALSEVEATELRDATEMLWRVRNLLHRRAERKHDRLTFPDQEDLAEELGFVDGITLAVEQFMQAYYRHARVVARTAERLVSRAKPQRTLAGNARVLEEDAIVLHSGALDVQSEALQRDPMLALLAYEWSWKAAAPLTPDSKEVIELLTSEPKYGERLREAPGAASLFLRLLCCVDRVPSRRENVVGELHESGLLLAMIPEFGPVTGRVQYDAYHLYTVDVHAVRAVEFLAQLVRGDEVETLERPCELARELRDRTPLTLATLLHDLGASYGTPVGEKGWRKQRQRGAEMALHISARLGLGEQDSAHVAWLVEQHLSLYEWATRRDTSDPETVAEFANTLGTAARLRDLYLLTVSVLATTNAREMTAWKARMLEDLYLACLSFLEGAEPHETRHGLADSVRDEVREGFDVNTEQASLDAFLDDMPDRYLLANPVEMIRHHARFQLDRVDDVVRLGVFDGPTEGVAELVVVANDRSGLLADVTGILAARGLEVVQAQIYTRPVPGQQAEAVDLFHVTRQGWESNPVDQELAEELQQELRDLERGELRRSELFRFSNSEPAWAKRRVPEVETEVVVDSELTPRFTVVDVFTRDRIGLLHFIAATLSSLDCTVALSKISTEGIRTADTFYLQPVSNPQKLAGLAAAVKSAIDRFHAEHETTSQ